MIKNPVENAYKYTLDFPLKIFLKKGKTKDKIIGINNKANKKWKLKLI
ncbi:hypothetical protein NWE60_01865 [Mycoplasmopsis felis]|nr:hypothetical protein [Mycoplasmopsis felis]WAM01366.1 hypothetical protein NWE60_01865 [Mycoplasmopsis felis]